MVNVLIIESEAGWGRKVDETIEFETVEKAVEYCKEYNNKWNPPRETTPEWYMYAKLENQQEYGMFR